MPPVAALESPEQRYGDIQRAHRRGGQAQAPAAIGLRRPTLARRSASAALHQRDRVGQHQPAHQRAGGPATTFRTTAYDLITEAAGRDSYTFTSSNRERDAFLSLYDSLSPRAPEAGAQLPAVSARAAGSAAKRIGSEPSPPHIPLRCACLPRQGEGCRRSDGGEGRRSSSSPEPCLNSQLCSVHVVAQR